MHNVERGHYFWSFVSKQINDVFMFILKENQIADLIGVIIEAVTKREEFH